MSNTKQLHSALAHRKREVISILESQYSDQEIKQLCIRFRDAPAGSDLPQELHTEGHPDWCFFAIVSFCSIMYLQAKFPTSQNTDLTAEEAADFVLSGMNAMLGLQEAASKPVEKMALTRLKQVRNQPKKRNRDNVEHDDILVRIDGYVQEKGVAPTCFNYFLKYLESLGYSIDEANKKVNAPAGSEVDWKRPRAFSTIDKWLQIYRNSPSN
jgi:hypothetical protein